MKRFKHLVIGGIETKVVNLILATVILMIAAFVAVGVWQNNMLTDLTRSAGEQQKEDTVRQTTAVMDQVARDSMEQVTAREARITNDVFTGTRARVTSLARYVETLLADPEGPRGEWRGPRKEDHGKLVAYMLMPEGMAEPAEKDLLPIGDVMAVLDDLQQYGYVTTKPYLGVKVGDSAAVQGQNLPAGAYLSEVVEGYCAHKAGLQAGDVIVGMDDTVISSYEGLVTAMNGHKAGDTVTVTVFRAGKYLTLELTFDARPRELDQPAQEPQTEPEPTESVPQNPFGFTLP